LGGGAAVFLLNAALLPLLAAIALGVGRAASARRGATGELCYTTVLPLVGGKQQTQRKERASKQVGQHRNFSSK
jgi:hypothetical protein